MKSIVDLSSKAVKEYFLKSKSYAYFDLPPYFDFTEILDKTNRKLNGNSVSDFCISGKKPKDFETVNYFLLDNKNGKYDWRPFQLIHPVLYLDLVNAISLPSNWKYIKNRFQHFKTNNFIECKSIPIISKKNQKKSGAQVLRWWVEVEQESIKKSLEFDYLLQTDIVDCYSSVYTHSIPWAIHTKEISKQVRDNTLFGNKIDYILQSMSYGQTNGIPQGSVIMDLLAELILGYADEIFTAKIVKEKINPMEFKILRYRDDYRIFSNSTLTIEKLIKLLTETLSELGFKLNAKKTNLRQDVITASIKDDKHYWIEISNKPKSLYEEIQLLHQFSEKYPNSGTLEKQLYKFYEKLNSKKKTGGDIDVFVSYFVDIAYKSPRTYPIITAILSKILYNKSEEDRYSIYKKILVKFNKIPNTSMLDIWLQRILIINGYKVLFKEMLCKIVVGDYCQIWNSDWLHKDFQKIINDTDIIDRDLLRSLNEVIDIGEISLFRYN